MTRPGDGPYAPEARLRGTLVHALLERLPALPPEQRDSMARAYVKARAPRLPPELRETFVGHALERARPSRPGAALRPGLAGRSADRRAGR